MKLVVLDGGVLNPGDVDWTPLAQLGNLTVYDRTDPVEVAERVAGAEIVLVNKTPLRRSDIPCLGGCRLIGVLATGANNLDLPDLARAGINVCNVPAYGPEDVAQHALALIMELARGTGSHTAGIREGEWSRRNEWCYWNRTPLSLTGLTMGLIGFGHIGQALGRYGAALGMEVLAWSPSRKGRPDYAFQYVELDEIFVKADIISLHCPLTPKTDKIINAQSLAAMKPGVLLINTARGGLVDEEAVAAALNSRRIGGFGADVLGVEPPAPDNPLLRTPNTLITPHMAWATTRARQNIIDIMADNIAAFRKGRPRNIINHAKGLCSHTVRRPDSA